MNQFAKPWTRFGLSEERWLELTPDERNKLSGTRFKIKKCDICGKNVTVLDTHQGATWCLEHAGSWKEDRV